MGITSVQAVSNYAGATSVVVTISATTVGNLIFVHGTGDNSGQTLSISDSKGNVYTTYTGFNNIDLSGGFHGETDLVGFTVDAFGGVTSVTVTSAGAANVFGSVSEYSSSNGWPASPMDSAASSHNFAASVTTFTSNAGSATAQAEELLVGIALFTTDPGTVTPTNSFIFNSQAALNDSRVQYAAYRVVSSTGTYAFTGTSANSTDAGAAVLAFKDNAAATTVFGDEGVGVYQFAPSGSIVSLW